MAAFGKSGELREGYLGLNGVLVAGVLFFNRLECGGTTEGGLPLCVHLNDQSTYLVVLSLLPRV